MKAPTLLKLPRKPKRTASTATLERYVQKVADVQRENARRIAAHKAEKKRREQLLTKIGSGCRVVPATAPRKRRSTTKKASTKKKATTKKRSTRRRSR